MIWFSRNRAPKAWAIVWDDEHEWEFEYHGDTDPDVWIERLAAQYPDCEVAWG